MLNSLNTSYKGGFIINHRILPGLNLNQIRNIAD